MPQALLRFQQVVCDGILQRYAAVRRNYDALPADAAPSGHERIRQRDSAVVLWAPTGSGKTLMATEILSRFHADEAVLWFWFAPFAGLVEPAQLTLRAQAPALSLLDLDSDRRLDAVRAGGVFVSTWQSVAAANQQSRLARSRSDAGASLDDLVAQARAQGLRVGCVVDEAHHGFHKAKEARRFFTDVLRPDYTLMMTATPRDVDAQAFAGDTGMRLGEPDDWAQVSRRDGVEAGLLKRGVKLVRFVAEDGALQQLIDFEHNALKQCTAMHRHLAQTLQQQGIPLTPLMLVQVPDGDIAMKDARRYLVDELGFADSAVRLHTAKEPDPDLIALAADPSVEVLIFKMAVALGFDAPRAFTLAALRGARDKDFGVQVIGRLMRVHSLLRLREGLPPELDYGYVFLANAESQEGLLNAGNEIARLTTQAPSLGTQTVVTIIGQQHSVQVLRSGETASLLIDTQQSRFLAADGREAATDGALADFATQARAFGLLPGLFADQAATDAAASQPRANPLPTLLAHDAALRVSYQRRDGVPNRLASEYLPPVEGRLEERVVDFIDFSPGVLAAMHQTLAKVLRVQTEIFSASRVAEDSETYNLAQLSPAKIAERVHRQISLFPEFDERVLFQALGVRFRLRLVEAGFPAPDDEEALDQALDLVLARHPKLLRAAYKLARLDQVGEREVELPALVAYSERLAPAARNVYSVFPPSFDSDDERAIAEKLDASPDVLRWHRNPVLKPESVALYRWDDGAGFYPDFVAAIRGRDSHEHVVLLEVKGPRGWGDPVDVAKAKGPAHSMYGRCVFVGREKKDAPFKLLKPNEDRLMPFSDFEITQLRWVER